MNKKILLVLYTFFIALGIISCSDSSNTIINPPKPEPDPKPETINIVSQFAFDGLAVYYKWADELQGKEPKSSDNNPKEYFKTLLNKADTEHGWSWITDDAEGLVKGFAGKSLSFGFTVGFVPANKEKKTYFAWVKYVFPNTPAAAANIQRLDFIGTIDGEEITVNNYRKLFRSNPIKIEILKLENKKLKKDRDITITPQEINTNPVLIDSIYTIGDKKIGYLFYTGFIYNYNNALYKTFSKFKQEQITDLVVDLRYNHGGSVSSAVYLASMIAPRTDVQNQSVLVEMSYNKYINNLFDKKKWSRTDKLGEYNSENFNNPLNVNLNLNKVYIIATADSYSASELTTFCLKPYMEVIHIGNHTGGKYTASWTVAPYNKKYGNIVYDKTKLNQKQKEALKNWAMQPIVAIYQNKNGENFKNTDGLNPDYEVYEGNKDIFQFTQLGDTKDVYLAQALYLITGKENYRPQIVATKSGSLFNTEYYNNFKGTFTDEIIKKAAIIDNSNLTTEQIKEF